MSNSDRLLRLLKIISMIDRQQGAPMDELVLRAEVSERTIYRDVEALNEAGLPVYFDDDRHRYFFSERVFLKPLTFAATEAAALLRAIDTISIEGLPFANELLAARDKVLASLPEIYREQAGRAADAIDIDIKSNNTVDTEIFAMLAEAVHSLRTIRLIYQSLSGRATESRVVNPYGVTLRDGRWYLVAWCHTREELRVFRADRIRNAELLPDRFNKPADFSLDEYFLNCVSVVQGETVQVRLRFSAQSARWVEQEHYHEQQQLEKLADGRLLFEAPFKNNWELKSWVLGFGSEVEVLEPPELRAEIADELEQMQKTYR